MSVEYELIDVSSGHPFNMDRASIARVRPVSVSDGERYLIRGQAGVGEVCVRKYCRV